jgi:hypothetical protein
LFNTNMNKEYIVSNIQPLLPYTKIIY